MLSPHNTPPSCFLSTLVCLFPSLFHTFPTFLRLHVHNPLNMPKSRPFSPDHVCSTLPYHAHLSQSCDLLNLWLFNGRLFDFHFFVSFSFLLFSSYSYKFGVFVAQRSNCKFPNPRSFLFSEYVKRRIFLSQLCRKVCVSIGVDVMVFWVGTFEYLPVVNSPCCSW